MFSGLSAGAAETVKGSKLAKSPKKTMKILNGFFKMGYGYIWRNKRDISLPASMQIEFFVFNLHTYFLKKTNIPLPCSQERDRLVGENKNNWCKKWFMLPNPA